MKKRIGRIFGAGLLGVSVFLLTLLAVEALFRLNSVYKWWLPKQMVDRWDLSGPDDRPVFPRDRLHEIVRRYKNYRLPNADLQGVMQTGEPVLSRAEPVAPEYMIRDFHYPQIRSIHEKSLNPRYGRVLFDVHYHFDGYGRRIVPGQRISPQKPNLLLIGCSLTFGKGVQDEQSMPYFLQGMLPGYNVYNLGITAAGLNDLLDDARSGRRLADLHGRGGAVVYSFIYDHIERTFCSVECYRRGWTADKSNYDFDQQGRLINYGSWNHSRPGRAWIFGILARSEFLKFVGYDNPRLWNHAELEKYVRLLAELRNYYAERGYDFYIYPVDGRYDLKPEMAELLARYGIPQISYQMQKLPAALAEKRRIVGDGHFSEVGNYLMAAQIAENFRAAPARISADGARPAGGAGQSLRPDSRN